MSISYHRIFIHLSQQCGEFFWVGCCTIAEVLDKELLYGHALFQKHMKNPHMYTLVHLNLLIPRGKQFAMQIY